MKCKFIVGQRVACIEVPSEWYPMYGRPPKPAPEFDEIYTISKIEVEDGEPYLFFTELNPEDSFHYTGFRPLPPMRQRAKEMEAA